jgi:hypothetical protein
MQIFVMLLFLAVWLLILWIGSIALEATGLERSRSRFQALSALTGTGFTTSQAELIVEHPKRRRITSYLIFLGNTGIVAFILIVILYARAGLTPPSLAAIGITLGVILVLCLSIWLGLIDIITTGILKATGKGKNASLVTVDKVLYQAGEWALVRLSIGRQADSKELKVENMESGEKRVTVLAIERADGVLSSPGIEEKLVADDYLLCYGSMTNITEMSNRVAAG